jgi:hypothetical protein
LISLIFITDESLNLLEGKFTELKISKLGSSGFTASSCKIAENCGFTATFPVPFMRPQVVSDILLVNAATSSPEWRAAMDTLENSLAVTILPHKMHETNPYNAYQMCVESITGKSLEAYWCFQPYHPDLMYRRQMSMSKLINVEGVATDQSLSDGIVFSCINSKNIGTGINELKDTAFAPLEQQGQIFASAANMCLGQLKNGLIHQKCCVAFMSTNGQLYQFGFVTLLYPSFPVMHITSRVIDAQDSDSLMEVAMHLHRMREFCRSQHLALQSCVDMAVGKVFVALDETAYFLKPISKVFERSASKLQSVLNMYQVFQRLHDKGVDVGVLPVAVLSGKLNEAAYMCDDQLIFPRLSSDFVMGVPADKQDFDDYLQELVVTYHRMHNAGVVHLDGYPSNLLWKRDSDGKIVIRFVDFDVATFLNSNFDVGIQKMLESVNFKGEFYYWGGDSQVARVQHDAWFVYMYSQMTSEERQVSSEAGQAKAAEGVVMNYWTVVNRLRATKDLVAGFNAWFADSWDKEFFLVVGVCWIWRE